MHSYHNKLLPNHFDESLIPISSIHSPSTRLATSNKLFLPRAVLFKLFAIAEPPIYFRICHRTLLTKIKKHELLVRKSTISLLDTSTNKQLLQKL